MVCLQSKLEEIQRIPLCLLYVILSKNFRKQLSLKNVSPLNSNQHDQDMSFSGDAGRY